MEVCELCKVDPECVVHTYSHTPFIDGRNYNLLCFCCASVPKGYHYDAATEELTVFDDMDPDRLHTPTEMVEDGWSEEEAKKSVRAVKRAIKKSKLLVVSGSESHVFAELILT